MATCKECIHYDICINRIRYHADENEFTGKELTDMDKACKRFKDKSKFIETAYPKTFESIRKIYTTAKNEAIKEFAERLNAKAQNANTWTGIEPVVTISDIEDTAKDLVGGNNATD